jgi:hypothetical protein
MAFTTTKMQSYVPSMTNDDYMTTSQKNHVANATSHISRNHISNYAPPWLQLQRT